MMGKRYILLLLALLAACSPMEIPDQVRNDDKEVRNDGALVPVSLSLDVAPVSSFGEAPATKADVLHEPDEDHLAGDALLAEVKTLTLLQFRYPKVDPTAEPPVTETDSDPLKAELVGWQYVDDYAAFLAASESFSLVASSDKYYNIIWAVANTSGRVPYVPDDPNDPEGPTTFGNFLERQNSSVLDETLGGSDLWFTVDDGIDQHAYLRMNGSVVLTDGVALGTAVPVSLKRNCAKIVVNVTNNTPGSIGDAGKVVLEQVQLQQVNRKYYYLTEFAAALSPLNFSNYEVYSPQKANRFDLPVADFTADQTSAGATQTFTFYVPANERGVAALNTREHTKNLHAPAGATRFCIYAHYGTDKPVTYTYYLGKDLISDFNLEPNGKYTYNITLTEKGDPVVDARVEDQAEIRFETDANSYLLNPPTRDGQSFVYAFPVRRAAVFWNAPGTNMGLYDANNGSEGDPYDVVPVDPLLETTPWTASVLWKSVTGYVSDDDFLVSSSGQGFNPDNPTGAAGHQPWIRIRVRSGMSGNALVAVKNAAGTVLWSWYLWITDYNPNVRMTPVAGVYIYDVPGGALHRYNGARWQSGEYVFAMDRNYGAPAASGTRAQTSGQFFDYGRRTPSAAKQDVNQSSTGSIRGSVQHPRRFYRSWDLMTKDNHLLAVSSLGLLDPKYNQHGGDYCEAGKSIYDPCPPGWQTPPNTAVWNGFTFSGGDGKTLSWVPNTGSEGALYYPEGYARREQTGSIFFPATGSWRNFSGVVNDGVIIWLTTMQSGVQYRIQSGSVSTNNQGSSAPVRCIRLH